LVQKFSRIKVNNALALSILLYGSEVWTLRQQDKKQCHRDEIFQKNSRVHPSDRRKNEEVLEEQQVEPVDDKLRRHKSNWLRRLTRMDTNKMPKLMLNYIPDERRRLERPLTRQLDEAELGLSRPNSRRMGVVVVVVVVVVVMMMMMMMMIFLTRSLI
jgi:hypothetical protein